MADVVISKDAKYKSQTTEPIQTLNGTDSVELTFDAIYATMGLKVTAANGTVTFYDVDLTERV